MPTAAEGCAARNMELPAALHPRKDSILGADAKLLTVSASAAYNIGVIAAVVAIANTCIEDVVNTGGVHLHTEFLQGCFGKIHLAVLLWVPMITSTLIMQMIFRSWAFVRANSAKDSQLLWDYAGLITFILYISLHMAVPPTFALEWSLPPGSTVVLLMEQLRLLMKVYAYVRTQVEAVTKQDGEEPNLQLSHFAYFLFAPTLVYEDHYPRTSHTRMRVVFACLLEIAASVLIGCEVYERSVVYLSRDFLLHRRPQAQGFLAIALEWVFLVMRALPATTLLLLITYYVVLVSVQSLFAEILRFKDRLFFKDWWNVTSFRTYYRTWNRIVQMWLFMYVYKDMRKIGASSCLAKFIVFQISSIFHEYLLAVVIGVLFPVQYVYFGICGFFLSFEPEPTTNKWTQVLGNFFVLLRIILGVAMFYIFYSLEYYARQICARKVDSYWDYTVPRSWFCELKGDEAVIS